MLELVTPGEAEPVSKAEAAAAIDDASDQGCDHEPGIRIHLPPSDLTGRDHSA
jgi:hypothetical protein